MISFGSEFAFAFFGNKTATSNSQKLLCLFFIETTFEGGVNSGISLLNCHERQF